MGLFFSTFLVVSGFALLFALYHSSVIGITALVLANCGQLLIYVSVAVSNLKLSKGHFMGSLLTTFDLFLGIIYHIYSSQKRSKCVCFIK
jgi:hypothetical protein